MGTWRRMAYPRQNSLRGDRRETPSEDSRRSRPAVYRSCRPKGGMNDKRFGYGKCGILKPNLCPPDRMLFSCNIFIFKQPIRICYS